MVHQGNHPQMAARFRLVNYFNLPRCIMMYTHFIPLSHYMWWYILHIFCTWLHIYNMHAFLICILYIRWMGSFILEFVASLIVISKKTDKRNRYLLGRAVSVSSGVSKQSNYILGEPKPNVWRLLRQNAMPILRLTNYISPAPPTCIWVNYNDLTATSLEIIVNKGNHPQMALIQVSELL